MKPDPATPDAGQVITDLPLFPLGTVLFPDGLLPLRIFEARYLDLMSRCLRTGEPFGVVTLVQGGEVRSSADPQAHARFEAVGCLARLLDCDSDQPGILQVRCQGTRRVTCESPSQQADGLWRAARATVMAVDAVVPVQPAQLASAAALRRAIATLAEQGQHPFLEPHRDTEAGWVANRWSEILPLPVALRHQLMTLPDAQARLQLVHGFLRRNGIIEG